MTGYTRFWVCKACGKRQETIDWPDVDVCDLCISYDPACALALDNLSEAKFVYHNAVRKFKAQYK